MARFPTDAKRSITVKVPLARTYKFFWDVPGHAKLIPGLDSCKRVGPDIYRFVYEPRSTGPVTITAQYTARYKGNGKDEIKYEGMANNGDNTDIAGVIRLDEAGDKGTKVTIQQTIAPDTPVPKLVQGLVRSFVEREASNALKEFLENIKKELQGKDQR
ncbi:MAG: SRPBCC family protein [Deltaproteobacteria bacterium]|nr:SRPBCC family protein [Deltaproteobacteria bacterium]